MLGLHKEEKRKRKRKLTRTRRTRRARRRTRAKRKKKTIDIFLDGCQKSQGGEKFVKILTLPIKHGIQLV